MEDTKENTAVKTEPMQTYINIGALDTGSIEVDLVSYRAKNEKVKYLTITVTEPIPPPDNTQIEGGAESGGMPKNYMFALDNEEAFMQLKKFFTQLEWKD